MSRSLKKGPYVDPRVLKKLANLKPGSKTIIKTWSRACTVTPEMVGFTFGVHNGRNFAEVSVTEDMVGYRLGEFAPTRKFIRHGGRMAKEEEQAQVQAEKAKVTAAQEQTVKK
ncbi:MAG: 30S ribosomal protein S19 [Candidatus Doudnabacteria bacterium]|nr:30S ribosomal protein S19 [Candidatus Doudnabacteria bacterium]